MSIFTEMKAKAKEIVSDSNFMFAHGRDDLAERNLNSLKFCGIMGFIITALLMLVTPLIMPLWLPSWAHFAILPTTLIMGVAAILYGRKKQHNYYVVQTMCILFYVLLLILLGYINAIAYPSEPDYLLVGFLVMMPVLFTINPSVMLAIIILAAALTGVLAAQYKSPQIAPNNSFSLVMGTVLSIGIFAVVFRAKTKQFRLQERYLADSRTDLLTGLLNKRSYELLCENLIVSLPSGKRCALFVLDVDNFKSFNDTYGHAKGDEMLKIVAQALKESFREEDKTGRIGGDEFSAFIVTSGPPEILQHKAETICEKVEDLSAQRTNLKTTVSVGVASFSAGGVSYLDAFTVADEALYSAKHDEDKGYEIRKVRK